MQPGIGRRQLPPRTCMLDSRVHHKQQQVYQKQQQPSPLTSPLPSTYLHAGLDVESDAGHLLQPGTHRVGPTTQPLQRHMQPSSHVNVSTGPPNHPATATTQHATIQQRHMQPSSHHVNAFNRSAQSPSNCNDRRNHPGLDSAPLPESGIRVPSASIVTRDRPATSTRSGRSRAGRSTPSCPVARTALPPALTSQTGDTDKPSC